MTPRTYKSALRQLEIGTFPENKIGSLVDTANEIFREHGYPANVAQDSALVLEYYWEHEVDQRQLERESAKIAAAAAKFRRVVEGAKRSRDYLRLPDARLWIMAGAWRAASETPTTIGLAAYLRVLETDMLDGSSTAAPGLYVNPSGRKTSLTQFAIRHVESHAGDSGRQGTPGQQRYGRNAFIAEICSLLLARRVTRQQVAQALKKTV